MKKVLLLLTLFCAISLTGCSTTIKSNNVRLINIGPESISPNAITADIVVSEQKIKGEASGTMMESDRLIREATATALGHGNTPTVEGPDLLVARNVYYERTGSNLKVIVTGYPAWYKNFRTVLDEESDSAWLIVLGPTGTQVGGRPQQGQQQQQWMEMARAAASSGEKKSRGGVDNYFSIRRNIITSGSPEWFDVEGGWIWGEGTSFGFEFGIGLGSDRGRGLYLYGDDDNDNLFAIGGGISVGKVVDLAIKDASLSYGMSAGVWGMDRVMKKSDDPYFSLTFGGPFIKLRCYGLELMYRGLIGFSTYQEYADWDNNSHYEDEDIGFAWVSQLKIGYTFETKKRSR